MPILSKKQSDRSRDTENTRPPHHPLPAPLDDPSRYHPLPSHPIPPRSELVFHCQLAHGSPTKDIRDFSNVKELYARIGEAFEIDPNSIIFCTLNTHKLDMTRLLGGQIGLDDFIFAHIRGELKTVTIAKQEASIGLTITDNGAGSAFVKKIKEGSVAARVNAISVGDMIHSIDEHDLISTKHYEVAKILKELPRFSTFTLRLIEPLKPFAVAPRSTTSKSSRPLSQLLEDSNSMTNDGSHTEGRGTLRLKNNGAATVEENMSPWLQKVTERVDDLLESFMGIRDRQLSRLIVDLSKDVRTADEFAAKLRNSELGDFQFPDDFMYDVWRVVKATT